MIDGSSTKARLAVTRYSVILPSLTTAVLRIRSNPVMCRFVWDSRLTSYRAASSQLTFDSPTKSTTLITAGAWAPSVCVAMSGSE
jgi:hypothetical protein